MSQAVATPSSTSSSPAVVRPASAGPAIRLNAFQGLMRRWTKLHPYNAGQVMRISGAGDRERWKQAVEAVIGEMGLGKPRFQHADQVVQYTPVEDIPIEQSKQDLEAFFNEELNRPFVAGDLPIRFCILPAPENGQVSHYLAAVYDHWIADSRAMRELMRRIFERYRNADHGAAGRLPALTLETPDFARLFRRHVGRLTRLAAIRESLKNIWRHRHGYRLNLRDPLDFDSRLIIRELPEGLIDRLHRFAKARGASVNDLFIALVAQAMGKHTAGERLGRPGRPLHFRRLQMGIGTIVDIRDAASASLDNVFNLYLSSYTVLLANAEGRSADEVTREVASRTAIIKRSKATVIGFWALVMARFWYDAYDSQRFQATLLHKTVPVVAGISNVNMSGTWVDPSPANGGRSAAGGAPTNGDGRAHHSDEAPQIHDYLRISPAGPLIPLVFTMTTIGSRLSLCVTYRTTAFQEVRLLQTVDDLMRRMETLGAAEKA